MAGSYRRLHKPHRHLCHLKKGALDRESRALDPQQEQQKNNKIFLTLITLQKIEGDQLLHQSSVDAIHFTTHDQLPSFPPNGLQRNLQHHVCLPR